MRNILPGERQVKDTEHLSRASNRLGLAYALTATTLLSLLPLLGFSCVAFSRGNLGEIETGVPRLFFEVSAVPKNI